MKSYHAIIAVLLAVIMIFIQFGGNNSIHTLYLSKPEVPEKVPLPLGWPPELDKHYPDLDLIDKDGVPFKISDYKGKVIIIIPINMRNPIVQSIEGAESFGTYNGAPSKKDIKSLPEYIKLYANGLSLPHNDLIFIHIIFHNEAMQTPSFKDAALWARHFILEKSQNQIVCIPADKIPDYATNQIVPRIQLVDKNFYLRAETILPETAKDYIKNVFVPMIPIALNTR